MDYTDGPNVITRVLIRMRHNGQRLRDKRSGGSERLSVLVALKMEKGAISQGKQVASRNWEKQGNEFSPTALVKVQHCC